MADTAELGTAEATILLNNITEFRIQDPDNSGDHHLFYPIRSVDVDENIPTQRVDLRQKRTYTQSDSDIDLNFTFDGTSDIMEEVYTALGNARVDANGQLTYPPRQYIFTAKDTQNKAVSISFTMTGLLMGRRSSQQSPTGAGLMISLRVRVISDLAVAKTVES